MAANNLVIDNYSFNVSVLEVLNRLRITVPNGKLKDIRPKTGEIVVTCPNSEHSGGKENNPDCHINLGTHGIPNGYFHCFACGKKGSFKTFVGLYLDSSPEYAKQWMLKNFEGRKSNNCIELDKIVIPGRKQDTIKTIDPSCISNLPSWCPYLSYRGLTRDTCEKFNVKYNPTLRQVIFPCYDENGNLIMTPARSIDSKIFYLNKDSEKPVYCLDNINKNNIKKALITEGPFDCLLANQYGFPAIATLGTPSDYQIEQINKSCINNLYLMFDNDDAGKDFTNKVIRRLKKGIMVTIVNLPKGKKDIGELNFEDFWKSIDFSEKLLYNSNCR